jgi:hypothetical protein
MFLTLCAGKSARMHATTWPAETLRSGGTAS